MDRNGLSIAGIQKVVVTISDYRTFLCLVFLVFASSCNFQFNNTMEGIWHTEFENVPGQMVDMEFEIRQNLFGGEWNGRWEIMELMISSNLLNVQATDSIVEVVLNSGLKFKGSLSEDGTSFDGILYIYCEEIPQTYTRVKSWASKMPARKDRNGRPVTTWNYRPPELIDDEWSVTSLKDAKISQQALDDLFQKVLDGKYQGLDALLVARGGDLVLEEYFHFGSRNEIHQIQSVTKSVTSLVFGIAYDEGLIGDLERPVYDFFPNYSDSVWVKEAYPISLKQVLMMSAGLDWHEKGVSYTNPLNDAIRMTNSGDM